jgi:hypothetical protein
MERSTTDFEKALRAYANADSSRLIEILRSRPISIDEQEELADELEFPEPPKKGRPRNEAMQWAAHTAAIIYRRWKRLNNREGINDWGLGDDMKNQSCLYAIELGAPWKGREQPDVEAVRQLLDRPKSRRNWI